MQFLFPGFLWALLLLSIPVIIHLFYFRRFKKVYFTNVRFLKELKEETSSRNKLKNLLVLLSRMLALAFLVFAFAQPILTKEDNLDITDKAVSIFVDNSFSMNALSEDVPLLEKAKSKAREIIQAFGPEDKIQILTHENFAKDERFISPEDALLRIDEIQTTPQVSNLSTIFNKQKNSFSRESGSSNVYFLSDFQKSITDLNMEVDSTMNVYLLPFQSVRENNVSIDSVWFAAPVPILNQNNKLLVLLKNHNDQDEEDVQLSILYENQTRPLGTLTIPPGGQRIDTISFFVNKTGWHKARLQIKDYPIQFDDEYRIAFEVDAEVKVLTINETRSNKFLTAAFEGLDYFKIDNQNKSQLQYASFGDYDLIVLNDIITASSGISAALEQYVSGGGNLLIFPNENAQINAINEMLANLGVNTLQALNKTPKTVAEINTEEFIFHDVFDRLGRNVNLPKTELSYSFNNFQRTGQEDLLNFRDGSAYISKFTRGDGFVYVSSAPLRSEVNNLVRNAEIFIPMIYKMAISKARRAKLAYVIGGDNIIETKNNGQENDALFKIKGEQEFIPRQYNLANKVLLDVKSQVQNAEFLNLELNDQKVADLAFNFDRKESNMEYFSSQELNEKYDNQAKIVEDVQDKNLTAYIEQQDKGTPLWKWCIFLVLAFLAIETLLLRLWKVS